MGKKPTTAKKPTKDKKAKAPSAKAKKKTSNPLAEGLTHPERENPAMPWATLEEVTSARRRVATHLAKIDTAALLQELTNLHATKALRTLKTSALLSSVQTKITEIELENGANRSRCVEIKMKVLTVIIECEAVLDAVRKLIQNMFAVEIKESGSTVAERKSAVDSAFMGEVEQLQQLEHVSKLADLVIGDIDQSGWSIRRIIDTLALSMERGSVKQHK